RVEYPIGDKIELSYLDNSLIFDFIGISLSNPQGVYYKVQLEGYENEWKPISNNTSEVYANLSPGKYNFNLIACNNSGVCSSPVTMKITITPPYWKTWWFYLIVLVVVITGLFTYIKI